MSFGLKTTVTADDNTLFLDGYDENLMLGTAYKANFADTGYAWPATASLVNGQGVANARKDKPAANLILPSSGATMTYVAGKGFQLGNSTTNPERVSLVGQGGELDINLTNNKIVYAWLTMPASDPGTMSGGYFISKIATFSNSAPGLIFLLSSYANRDFRFKFGNNPSTTDIQWIPAVMPVGPHLWGLARMTYSGDPVIADGTYIELWFDGICVVRSLTTTTLTAVATDLSFGRPTFSTGSGWTTVAGLQGHAFGVEDLTISGRSAQQCMQREMEIWADKFAARAWS